MKSKAVLVTMMLGAVTALTGCDQFQRDSAPATNDLVASGTVEATEAQLGFQATGRVATLDVGEGDAVRAGDALAHLDRTELKARRAQAVAQVAVARAMLLELERGPGRRRLRRREPR